MESDTGQTFEEIKLLNDKQVPEMQSISSGYIVEDTQILTNGENEDLDAIVEDTQLLTNDENEQTSQNPHHEEELSNEENRPHLRKTLNLFNSVTLVVGSIIGSGIFITPTSVLQYSGSFGMALIIWVFGGIIVTTGALVFIELGTLIKDSGADYAYLREGYSFDKKRPAFIVLGNAISFLFIWSSFVLLRPLAMGVMTQTCGRYLCQAIAGGNTPPELSVKLIAISVIIIVTLVNVYSLKLTAMIINILSVAKLLALGFIIILGIWQLIEGENTKNFTNAFEGTTSSTGDIALGFYSVLWAYSGWNILNYAVEESKDNEKNLPRGLFIGMPIVITCYILINISYFAGLSKEDLLSSPATALTFGEAIIGKAGLVIIPLLVAASTFGSSTGEAYSSPRGAFSAARHGVLPEVFCLIHNTSKTPVPAIIFQSIMGSIFVLLGSINQLIDGFNITAWIFYCLVFIAAIIMRFTKRKEKRPFKVWIIAPVFMIVVSLFLVVIPIALVPEERITLGIAIVFILLGLPIFIFFAWDKFRPKIFNKISEKITKLAIILLNTSSTRSSESEKYEEEIVVYSTELSNNA